MKYGTAPRVGVSTGFYGMIMTKTTNNDPYVPPVEEVVLTFLQNVAALVTAIAALTTTATTTATATLAGVISSVSALTTDDTDDVVNDGIAALEAANVIATTAANNATSAANTKKSIADGYVNDATTKHATATTANNNAETARMAVLSIYEAAPTHENQILYQTAHSNKAAAATALAAALHEKNEAAEAQTAANIAVGTANTAKSTLNAKIAESETRIAELNGYLTPA